MFLGMTPTDADKSDAFRGTNEGGRLKETGTIHWTSPNTGATNETGFSALPGGQRNIYGKFSGIGSEGKWHTSTAVGENDYSRILEYLGSTINRSSAVKLCGFSVRCIKDN